MSKRKLTDELESAPEQAEAPKRYITLTTHANSLDTHTPLTVNWGELDPIERGPIIATNRLESVRNAIGAHSGSYCIYRALAVATGALDPKTKVNLSNTHPWAKIGPFKSWGIKDRIVTLDPFGHMVQECFAGIIAKGYDIRPTIAVTKAQMTLPEVQEGVRVGRLKPDGKILLANGQINVTKAAIEPVWNLPGLAKRFGVKESALRRELFQQTNGMYPELLTRWDLKTFLPPIGGLTVYIFGNVQDITDPEKELAVRVHDECNGSDVFGSDICTCRPYLTHAVEVCIETAQKGGAGVCIYYRKEGRSLGEVTKYLVYNARKRQEGGDKASEYFNCTQHVAGVQDTRFQDMMPDALHWLGITKIDHFISMSNMKYDAIIQSGIEIVNRVPIPEELVPEDAQVEIQAKVFAGYEGGDVYTDVTAEKLKGIKGRPNELNK